MDSYQCVKCKYRLFMLDGSIWCSITMKPVGKGFLANCPNFELGDGALYKAEPQGMIPKQKIKKVEAKETKPKAPPKIIKRKTPPGQTRLF